jgi:glycerol-3-phosphate acyltransferase PlsY
MDFLLFGVIAYLLGSIPTAVWVGKSYYGIDVREHGSKNAGATNTFRVLGKRPGILVLIIDVVKGALAVLLPTFILSADTIGLDRLIQIQLVSAIGAIVGHVFPIFANFNGGKGVATSLGVIIGIHPPAAGICLLVFLLVFLLTKYVSLGAIVTSFAFPVVIIFVFQVQSLWLIGFSILLGSTVIITHKKNIVRLLKGEESKMNLFKK